jgi:ABC-type Fe3+/spermidine/putrescine transport system ATPase subunit
VADFIGETNFIQGKVRSREGAAGFVETESGVFEGVFADPNWKPEPGEAAVLSVRPESWILADSRAASNSIEGEILDSIYLGELAQYRFRAGAVELKIVEMNPHLSARAREHRLFASANRDDVVVLKP